MEKLELKHISPYLPYGLKVQIENKEGEKRVVHVIGFHDNGHVSYEDKSKPDFDWLDIAVCYRMKDRINGYFFTSIQNAMPLFRPLPDLVKLLPNGEIPLMELAKIAFPKHTKFRFEGDIVTLMVGDKPMYAFNYNWAEMGFYTYTHPYGDPRITPHQLQLFEYLFANMFDVYNLIPAGIAEDINSIEQ